jgi:hypothetical protein
LQKKAWFGIWGDIPQWILKYFRTPFPSLDQLNQELALKDYLFKNHKFIIDAEVVDQVYKSIYSWY